MARDRDNDEREKPSWRDLDAKRHKSKHISQDAPARPEFKSNIQKRGESLAKKALEDLFQGKKSKEQEKEWKKVFEGSPKNFSTRASAYTDKHGLPREWDDLLRLLDHHDPAFLRGVLDKMEELSADQAPARLDLLVGKLRILKMTADDDTLLQKMDRMLNDLSGRV